MKKNRKKEIVKMLVDFDMDIADEEQMMNALADIKDNFQYSWGQKLVNVQRALHDVRYAEDDDF